MSDRDQGSPGSRLDDEPLLAAVRRMIDAEVRAATQPGITPPPALLTWQAYTPLTWTDEEVRAAVEQAARDHVASWSYFALQDLSVVDRTLVVCFRWREPGCPDLRHVVLVSLEFWADKGDGAVVAVAQSILRSLLAPTSWHDPAVGWRQHVTRTWLDESTVVVRRRRRRDVADQEDRQNDLDRTWLRGYDSGYGDHIVGGRQEPPQ